MSRRLLVGLTLSLALAGLAAGEEKKLDYTVYGPFFEKNNSGLKADKDGNSFLVLKDQGAFDKIFGSGRVMKAKPKLLPKDYFDKHVVIAVIKRGNQVFEYTVKGVTLDDGKVRIAYDAKAKGDPKGTAKFASPLVVGVAKGGYKSVEFVENKKALQTVAVEK